MPAPESATYSVAALVAANTSFRDLVDAHATLPGSIAILSSADVFLASIPLSDPCGTVNGATGQLTITPDGGETSATAGTAAYAEIRNGSGVALLSLPCQAGTEPVAGKCVIVSLSITLGSSVEAQSVVIG